MTYKLITEAELKKVIDTINFDMREYGSSDNMAEAFATLRAVMEREGPKFLRYEYQDGLYTLPEEPTT